MRAPRRSARSLVCSRGRSGHSREAPGKPQTERAEAGQGAPGACRQEATNRTTVCPLGALTGCGLRSAGDTPGTGWTGGVTLTEAALLQVALVMGPLEPGCHLENREEGTRILDLQRLSFQPEVVEFGDPKMKLNSVITKQEK